MCCLFYVLLLLLLLLLLLPGMLYCMEHLAANLDWLKEKLQPLEDSEWPATSLLALMLLSLSVQRMAAGQQAMWQAAGSVTARDVAARPATGHDSGYALLLAAVADFRGTAAVVCCS
jgi:hypothetical protein